MRRLALTDYVLVTGTLFLLFVVAYRHQRDLVVRNTMLQRQHLPDEFKQIGDLETNEEEDEAEGVDETAEDERADIHEAAPADTRQGAVPRNEALSAEQVQEAEEMILLENIDISYAKDSQNFQGGPRLVIYNRVPMSEVGIVEEVVMPLCESNGFAFHFSTIFSKLDINTTEQHSLAKQLSHVASKAPVFYDRHLYYTNFTRYGYPQPVYINVIRDPLQRILSHYYTVTKQRNDDTVSTSESLLTLDMMVLVCLRRVQSLWLASSSSSNLKFAKGKKTLKRTQIFDDCVAKRRDRCLMGISSQMRFFCGQEPNCLYGEIDALSQAKYNLVKNFGVVGLFEELDGFFSTLEKAFPSFFAGASDVYQSIKDQYNTKNVIGYAASSRKALSYHLDNEFEFYYYARQVFYDLQKRLGNES